MFELTLVGRQFFGLDLMFPSRRKQVLLMFLFQEDILQKLLEI